MNAPSKIEAAEATNMKLWHSVEKTDPRHTKKVNQRGGFTAISAHYQVMRATEAFGPVGIGWGYMNADPIFHDNLVIIPVTIWHGNQGQFFGPVYGSAEVRDSKGRLDADSPKKAATDGLTKGLSQLGFNADVFLGRFDDNKYVQQLEREFSGEGEKAEGISDADRDTIQTLAEAVGKPVQDICAAFNVPSLKGLNAKQAQAAIKRLQSLKPKEPANA